VAQRGGKGRTAPSVNQEGETKRAGKIGVIRGEAGISRLFGAAKLKPVPGADNPRYATAAIG